MLASKLPFKEFTALLNPHSRRIVAGIALSAIGRGMTLSLLMVYLHDMRGFTISFGGLLMGWGALFGIVCTAPLGALVDRIGPKKVMLAGLLMTGFSALAFAFVTTHTHAFIAMTLFAFGGQCVWPSQMVILTRVTPVKDRTKIFGFNFMLMNLGLGVGGFLSAIIIREDSIFSYQIMYFIDSLTYLVFIFFIWGLDTPHAGKYIAKEHEPDKGSYRELFAIKELSILTIAGIILLTFGYGPLQSGLPVYATQYLNLAPNWLGIIFGVNTFAIVAFQPLVLKLIANYSKYTALIAVAVIWALSWLVVGISPYLSMLMAGIALCISQLIFAFGEMVHAPTSPALTQELAPEHIRGRASALTSLQWGISGIAGPAIAGLMIGAHLEQLWVLLMAFGVLLPIPFFAYLKRIKK
ncbi:MFS transporter [Actinobacteria bacterium IMCC26103]|nr:MFS transporter [Actinobacteria bacterium IMCC26103]